MSDENRRMLARRQEDHIPPCSVLLEHITLEKAVLTELNAIKTQLAEMACMLTVFKTTKGFVTTVKWIGIVVIGTAALFGTMAGAAKAIKIWAQG